MDRGAAGLPGVRRQEPEGPAGANAAYWLGETYYVSKDYPNAAAVFARNYRTYGADSHKSPDNLLKLGMSLAALGQKDKACVAFAELTKRHPERPDPGQADPRPRARHGRLHRLTSVAVRAPAVAALEFPPGVLGGPADGLDLSVHHALLHGTVERYLDVAATPVSSAQAHHEAQHHSEHRPSPARS